MKPEDIAGLMIPVTWLVMMAVEAFGTGRAWPAVRWWRTKSLAFFVMVMTLNAMLPGLLPPSVTALHVLDASKLGLVPSIVVGYLAFSLVGRDANLRLYGPGSRGNVDATTNPA